MEKHKNKRSTKNHTVTTITIVQIQTANADGQKQSCIPDAVKAPTVRGKELGNETMAGMATVSQSSSIEAMG